MNRSQNHLKIDHLQLQAFIRLHHEPGLSAQRCAQLMAAFGDPMAIFQASLTKLTAILPKKLAVQLLAPASKQVQNAIETALDWSVTSDCHLITWADSNYPDTLKHMYDPPMLLYIKGDLGCLHKPCVAIVGARDASSYGLEVASQLAFDLAQAGWCVVSGLARGIDAAAHQGALMSAMQCSSLAVMGHGLHSVYPPQNVRLAQHMLAQQCALLSELGPDTPPRPHHFPRRNRLVAGLVRGVIVVEAAQRSGSLITARLANELGRDVFAVPGPVTSPASQGVHGLIKQGACLIENAHDVLRELGGISKNSPPCSPENLNKSSIQSPNADQSPAILQNERSPTQLLLLQLIGRTSTQVSQLLLHTHMTPQSMNIELTHLELDGLIVREGHGVVYALKGVK
jgi:DNA processing protein